MECGINRPPGNSFELVISLGGCSLLVRMMRVGTVQIFEL